MATARKKATKKKDAVAKTKPGAVAVYDYGENAGAGWETTTQEDFTVPRIKQLQSLSPECEEGGDAQVEGAKAGLFFNTVTKELLVDFNFILVRREHVYVEWIPEDAGGGFVGVHQMDSPIVADAKANAVGRDLKTEAGNDLIDTFEMCLGILNEDGTEVDDFAMMSMTVTKQRPYRDMMTRLRTLKGSKSIPLFAHRQSMVTVKATSKSNKPYFNVEMPPLMDDTSASLLNPMDEGHRAILDAARGFADGLASGEHKVKYDEPKTSKADDDTDEVF